MDKHTQDDDAFYADFDKETALAKHSANASPEASQLYCVFGNNSGFAYSSWASLEQATQAAVKKMAEYRATRR
jgi:hypothetical protein